MDIIHEVYGMMFLYDEHDDIGHEIVIISHGEVIVIGNMIRLQVVC